MVILRKTKVVCVLRKKASKSQLYNVPLMKYKKKLLQLTLDIEELINSCSLSLSTKLIAEEVHQRF